MNRVTDLQLTRHSTFNPTSHQDIVAEKRQREARVREAAKRSRMKFGDLEGVVDLKPSKPKTKTLKQIREEYLKERARLEIERERIDKLEAERLAQEIEEQELARKRREEAFENSFITMKQISLETFEKYKKYGVTYSDLFSSRRKRIIVLAKQECYFRSRMETPQSLPVIGRYFGGKDHSTVLHGIRKYERYQRILSLPVGIEREMIIPLGDVE